MKTKDLKLSRRIVLWIVLVLAILGTGADFIPAGKEAANVLVERGRREMAYVGRSYDFDVLKSTVEGIVGDEEDSVWTEWAERFPRATRAMHQTSRRWNTLSTTIP